MGKDVGPHDGAIGMELRGAPHLDRGAVRVQERVIANIEVMPGGPTVVPGGQEAAVLIESMHIELMGVVAGATERGSQDTRYATVAFVHATVLAHEVAVRSVSRATGPILAADGMPVPIKDIALDQRVGPGCHRHAIAISPFMLVVVNVIVVDLHGPGLHIVDDAV